MTRPVLIIAAGLLAVLMAVAHTASAQDEETQGWFGAAGLGYLASSGNSDTVNSNGFFDLGYEWRRWLFTGGISAFGADSEGVTTVERYTAKARAQFDWNEFDYLFGLGRYEKDRFSGVARQTSQTFGYGRRVLNNDVHILNLEAGLGLRQLKYADGMSEDGAVARLGGDYTWNFREKASFTEELDFEIGSDNVYTQSVTALNFMLRESLQLSLAYTIKNNSDVPAGLDKTDTYTSINLGYEF